jgi:hypothetical protein
MITRGFAQLPWPDAGLPFHLQAIWAIITDLGNIQFPVQVPNQLISF